MRERRLRIGTLGSFIVANKFMPREGKPNIGIIELIEPHVVNSGSGFTSEEQTGDNLWQKTFRFSLIFRLFANQCEPWGGLHGSLSCCTKKKCMKKCACHFQSGVYTTQTGKSAIICNKAGVNNVGSAISWCRMCTSNKHFLWELPWIGPEWK